MKENVKIYRDKNGVTHIEAESQVDVYWGMGYAHGVDRGMQMLLMRILGQGRLSELLDASDASLEIDKFFIKEKFDTASWITITKNDPLIGRTALLSKNSWGTDWGNHGFAYAHIPYAISAFTEAYGVVSVLKT